MISQLLDRLTASPVSGYRHNQEPATEVVALTAMALAAHGRSKEARLAAEWLVEQQAEDGRLGVRSGLSTPGWPTSLAIAAWQAADSHEANIERATAWLLRTQGKPLPKGGYCAHDTSLVGWPWVVGTHSWLEPTAWAVLSLRSAGKLHHERVIEARQLLVDRILPDGGCNYGNTVVLDQVLRPHVEPTGLVMLALAGLGIDDPRIERSLEYLRTQLRPRQGTASLCFAILGLAAHNRLPAGWRKHWEASARRALLGDGSPHKDALLALAALGAECPLIPDVVEPVGSRA